MSDGAVLPEGTLIGPWKLVGPEGAGAFGRVYRCERAGHPEAGLFALKLALEDNDRRFRREAEVLQLLSHPSVPHYEDTGLWTSPSGLKYPYVVMGWVEGASLYDWAKAGPRSSREVLQVLAQLAAALAAAHERGVIHRDVKGENIRVSPTGRVVLLDWGSGWCERSQVATDGGLPPGTTAYRPPSQLRLAGRGWKNGDWQSTPADDLYSLGVTLYRVATGDYPQRMVEAWEERVVRPGLLVQHLDTMLESTILRLLSEDERMRGTAAQLAHEVRRRALTVGPAANRTLSRLPARDLQDTLPASRPALSEVLGWRHLLSSAGAALVGGLLVAVPTVRIHQEQVPTPEAESVPAYVDLRQNGDGRLSASQKVPAKPPPGTKHPPCRPRLEVALNGGCWMPHEMRPPCEPGLYEYEGRCFAPSAEAPRIPTSVQQ